MVLRTKKVSSLPLLFCLLIGMIAIGCTGDVSGVVRERNADGSIGNTIQGASVSFTLESTNEVQTLESGANGQYSITLDTGKYILDATHPDFQYAGDDPTYLIVNMGANTAHVYMIPNPAPMEMEEEQTSKVE